MPDLYPIETSTDEYEYDIMEKSREALAKTVVGHRIVKVERKEIPSKSIFDSFTAIVLTLDTNQEVILREKGDCCAFAEVDKFLLHADKIDHVITSVGTTGGYKKWHIIAEMSDVLELDVSWSEGNGCYIYGFDIEVVEPLSN